MQIILEDGLEKWGTNLNIDKLPENFRLFYTFHEKEYFGGAHGLMGILYLMMKAFNYNRDFLSKNAGFSKILLNSIKASLRFVVTY